MATTMHVLDESGHTTLTFDDSADGQAQAALAYERHRGEQLVGFAGDGEDTELVRLDEWVPGFEVVYWVPPLVGG